MLHNSQMECFLKLRSIFAFLHTMFMFHSRTGQKRAMNMLYMGLQIVCVKLLKGAGLVDKLSFGEHVCVRTYTHTHNFLKIAKGLAE